MKQSIYLNREPDNDIHMMMNDGNKMTDKNCG